MLNLSVSGQHTRDHKAACDVEQMILMFSSFILKKYNFVKKNMILYMQPPDVHLVPILIQLYIQYKQACHRVALFGAGDFFFN